MAVNRREFVAGVMASVALPTLVPLVVHGAGAAADTDGWVATIAPADLAEGGFNAQYAEKHQFILARTGNQIMAVDTKCTHKGCAVKPGGKVIVCPCHGARYDAQGHVLKGPAKRALGRHPLRLSANGVIEVDPGQTVAEVDPQAVLDVAPPATGPSSQPTTPPG